jgi:hypothetical protein
VLDPRAFLINSKTGRVVAATFIEFLSGNSTNPSICFTDSPDSGLQCDNAGAVNYVKNGTNLGELGTASSLIGGSDTQIQFNNSGSFDGSPDLTWDYTTKKLGLGISSPATLLHLSSATGTSSPTPTELRIATTDSGGDWSTTDPWGRISYYNGDSSAGGPKIHAAIDAISNGSAGTSSSLDFKIVSNTDDTLRSVMRITFQGNLGIGTAVPSARTHITATSEGSDEIALRLENYSGNAGTETVLQFAPNISSSPNRGAKISGLLEGDDGTNLLFYTNPNSASPTERMRISSDGTVDIAGNLVLGPNNAPAVKSDTTGVTGADQITNMMSLTQAEYDAIVSPDANTFYVITA